MYPEGHISRKEEAEIPEFKDKTEAVAWFTSKYGSDNFKLTHIDDMGEDYPMGRYCYFYDLIFDHDNYDQLRNSLGKPVTDELLFSYQSVQIFDTGLIHIVH